MAKPAGIILCGKFTTIAKPVIEGLLPEYEVIHMILSVEAGVSDIPLLLEGKIPPATDPENIGSRDYSKTPVAVVTGRMYDEAAVKEMREACKGKRGIHWLSGNPDTPAPPQGPLYADHIVKRVRACLDGLAEKGELNGEGVHLY